MTFPRLATALLALAGASITSMIHAAGVGDVVPGMVVVRFTESANPSMNELQLVPAQFGISEIDEILAGIPSPALEPFLPNRHPNASAARAALERTYFLNFDDVMSPDSVVALLVPFAEFEQVRIETYARAHYFGTKTHFPPDSRFGDQWNLHNSENDTLDIDAPEAWEIERGVPSIIIGITDSGTMVDTSDVDPWELHSDINRFFNSNEDVATSGVSGTFNYDDIDQSDSPIDVDELPDNVIGHNFSNGAPSGTLFENAVWAATPTDILLKGHFWEIQRYYPHGLHVESVAASKEGGSNPSVCGVAPLCKVYHVRISLVLDPTVEFDPENPVFIGVPVRDAQVITHAAMYADVINMSWGYDQLNNDQRIEFEQAVKTASDPEANGGFDCVLVAAVGNNSEIDPDEVVVPARLLEVLGVGNMTKDVDLFGDSAWGPEIGFVSVVAPVDSGIPVESHTQCTGPGGGTGGGPCPLDEAIETRFGGTSAASPQAAGLAALIRSRFPGLNQQQVRDRIINSAEWYWSEPRSNEDQKMFGQGKINAYRALTEWGAITTNTTWSATATRDGNYYVSGDLSIESGAILTINAGVVVKVAPDHEQGAPDVTRVKITVKSGGTLNIAGSAGSPVTFESFTDSPPGGNDWAGITFEAGSTGSISHANIKNAGWALTNHTSLTISNLTIEDGTSGIESYANLTLLNSTVRDLATTGILARSGNLTLDNVSIHDCGGTAIANGATMGVVSISNCDIDAIDSYGIALSYAAASVTIGNTTVDATSTGILLGNQSSSTLIHDCAVRASDIGISLYGVSDIDILDTVLEDNETTGIYATAGTFITVASDTISGSVVGVFFDAGTGGTINANCLITDNSVGLKFDNNATGTVRQTRITGNNNGVASLNGSTPDLGVATSGSGCGASGPNLGLNSIYSNTNYNIVNAVAGTTLPAEGNWWNANPPKASKFFGSVDRDPYICGDPNPASPWVGPGVEDKPAPKVPTRYALGPSRPNPFNPTTAMEFDIPSPGGDVEISVFDVNGARVRTLVDRHHEAGTHSVTWTGRNDLDSPVASGIYFVRMTAPSFTQTRKLVLLK